MVWTIENLEKCFETASKIGANYVGLSIHMEGFPANEVIINPTDNFDKKLEYIKNAYDDVLYHKYSKGIFIEGFTYGDTYEEIEKDLV